MYPHTGPNPRRKYAYSPPASGIAAPSSAKLSAPNIDNTPPTIHAALRAVAGDIVLVPVAAANLRAEHALIANLLPDISLSVEMPL